MFDDSNINLGFHQMGSKVHLLNLRYQSQIGKDQTDLDQQCVQQIKEIPKKYVYRYDGQPKECL